MGLFNLFKKPEPRTQPKQEQSFDEFMADLRAQRMAERLPVLSRGAVKNAPEGFDHFNLNDVMVGTVPGPYDHYLFAGDNALVLRNDVAYLNEMAALAGKLAPSAPPFYIEPLTIAFDPFPDKLRQGWSFSKLVIEPKTETGKLKKYPVAAIVETMSGELTGKLYYTIGGKIGKGNIVYHTSDPDAPTYSADFINGVISHVWKSDRNGKTALYNKNL